MVRVLTPEQPTAAETANAASRSYLLAKAEAARADRALKAARERLFTALEEAGETDDLGHVRFTLPDSFDGVAGVVKQRRISRRVDQAEVERIADEKGLHKDLFVSVEVVNEDAIMQALVEGVLSEEDVDKMYPVTETFALVTEKVK